MLARTRSLGCALPAWASSPQPWAAFGRPPFLRLWRYDRSLRPYGCLMALRAALKIVIIAIVFGWASLVPRVAAATGADLLKAEIDDFFHYLDLSSNGVLHWEDADSFDVRDDGDGAVAVIVNGHLSVRDRNGGPKPLASITLDRVEVRRRPAGDNKIELVVALPSLATL